MRYIIVFSILLKVYALHGVNDTLYVLVSKDYYQKNIKGSGISTEYISIINKNKRLISKSFFYDSLQNYDHVKYMTIGINFFINDQSYFESDFEIFNICRFKNLFFLLCENCFYIPPNLGKLKKLKHLEFSANPYFGWESYQELHWAINYNELPGYFESNKIYSNLNHLFIQYYKEEIFENDRINLLNQYSPITYLLYSRKNKLKVPTIVYLGHLVLYYKKIFIEENGDVKEEELKNSLIEIVSNRKNVPRRTGRYSYTSSENVELICGNLVNRLPHGEWIIRHKNGKVWQIRNYEYGKPIGDWVHFTHNGDTLEVLHFKDGTKISTTRYDSEVSMSNPNKPQYKYYKSSYLYYSLKGLLHWDKLTWTTYWQTDTFSSVIVYYCEKGNIVGEEEFLYDQKHQLVEYTSKGKLPIWDEYGNLLGYKQEKK